MLTELRIENFAIIDRLELRLGPGLITFTGETGAGKSIIIDAVETLMGGRIDATMVRTEAKRAHVEGAFRIPAGVRSAVHAILEREDLLDDPEYVTLGREIKAEGRSVARVNGRSVNVSLLKELGEYLVDVHGQSQHLSLMRVRQHLDLLDRFAETEETFQAYRQTYNRLLTVRQELAELRKSEQDAVRRSELLAYQIEEIESAALKPEDEEALRTERNRLANAESLATLVQEALLALDEDSPEAASAVDLLGLVVNALNNLTRVDASQTKFSGQAQSLFDNLTDLTGDLRTYLEEIEFNPSRLEEVEERLELIGDLKRKYGGSVEAVTAYGEQAQKDLDAITHAEERTAELEIEEADLLAEVSQRGQALSAARHTAAESLSRAVEVELDDLRMAEAQFGVDFRMEPDPEGALLEDGQRVAFDETGLEQVEFLVAPNPGEGLKPLVKIASGGETSRLMLALKNVLARADQTPTLIFDEIDQGIGGRVGAIVGHKLWTLARQHQVLCVTHLPQLAGFSDQHYRVLKKVADGRTTTKTEALTGQGRLMELAQMMGEVSEGTLQSANEILQGVKEVTSEAV